MIFHIVPEPELDAVLAAPTYEPPSLATDGFVHCCTHAQLGHVANTYFAGQERLAVLMIEEKRLSARVELELSSDETGMFPHVYGPVEVAAVTSVLMWEPHGRVFDPADLTVHL